MTVVKLISSAGMLCLAVAGSFDYSLTALFILFFTVIALTIPIPVKEILKRNIIILSFLLFYIIFGVLSAIISNTGYNSIIITSLKIILIFNTIWFAFKWTASEGIINLIALIPSERLKLYFLLLAKGIYLFRRNSEIIIMQIRSRLYRNRKNNKLLARYYTRNMIFKELYSLQYIQASLYTRLPVKINILSMKSYTGPAELLIPFSILIFIARSYIPFLK